MHWRSLNRIGLLTAAVYAANAIHYGWTPSQRTTVDDVLAYLTAGLLLLLYWAGYAMLRRLSTSHSFRAVFLPAMLLVVISFFTIPYDSTDVFLYMDAGWEQAHYGLNPYSHVLRDIQIDKDETIIRPDWMLANKNPWTDLPFVYGFSFALLVKFLAWLGNGNWWLTLALFKAVNVTAYAVTASCLWGVLRALKVARPDLPLYLYAWSPLVLQHHIANAHNDVIVGCLLVVAIYAVIKEQEMWALPLVIVATLVKYATAPLIPLVVWYVGKRKGSKSVAITVTFGLLTAAILGAPYIQDISRFRFDLIAAQLNKITAGSLFAFLFYIYRVISPGTLATFGAILKAVLWSLSAVLIVREMFQFFRRIKPSVVDLISASAFVLFVVIFVASSQFYAWYLGMILPLALLLPVSSWLQQLTVLLSATHVLSLTSLSRKGIGYFVLPTTAALARQLSGRR